MLKLKKVAVTGDIASGKSTICHFFEELGSYVIRSDDIVSELLIPESEIGEKVIALLGEKVLQNGKLDKSKIGKIVFDDHSLLRELEKILHPEVQKIIKEHYEKACRQDYPLFVAEVPLLFEANQTSYYDYIVYVTAPLSLRSSRFTHTQAFCHADFLKREKRYLSFKEKITKAHFLIKNDGTREEAKEQVKNIFKQTSNL